MQRLYKQFFLGIIFLMIGLSFVLGSFSFGQVIDDPNPGNQPQVNLGGGSSVFSNSSSTTQVAVPSSSNQNTVNMDYNGQYSNNPIQVDSTICASPEGATRNSITGICSCPTGQKEVDGKCRSCADPDVCCGVQLNTSIPFIGSCIESEKKYAVGDETGISNQDAFPVLIGSLTKILISVILITSFILIVVAGVMIASGKPAEGKKMIINVAIGLALLGASGVILHLINPNFFG